MVKHLVMSCPNVPTDIKDAFVADPSGITARDLKAASVDGEEYRSVVFDGGNSTADDGEDAVSQLLAVAEPAQQQTPARRQRAVHLPQKLAGTSQSASGSGMGRSRNTVWQVKEFFIKLRTTV